jgi:hypothetical protein
MFIFFIPVILITIISILLSKIYKNKNLDVNVLLENESLWSYYIRSNKGIISQLSFTILSIISILLMPIFVPDSSSHGDGGLIRIIFIAPLAFFGFIVLALLITKFATTNIRFFSIKKKSNIISS